MSKFYTVRGNLTVYAFSCGHIEAYNINSNNYIQIFLDGTWHIKGIINEAHIWEVFDRKDTKAARKRFNALRIVLITSYNLRKEKERKG